MARRPRYPGKHPRKFEQRYKELTPQSHPDIHAHIRSQGRTPAGTHVPVLVAEVMDSLKPSHGEIVADCSVGYGGHAIEFIKRIAPGGRLIGFDVDATALERARSRLTDPDVPVTLLHSNFAGIAKAMTEAKIDGYDIIFADLGVSSMQLDDPARGFSYKHDGPLDLRMDLRIPHSAADLLLRLSEAEISAALRELADEPDHQGLAAAIVRQRQIQPITTTRQLVDLIFECKGVSARSWRRTTSGAGELHPAALAFQALRILVNDELGSLAALLRAAPYCLRPGGRIGIISFHSGEDRLVKHAFRDGVRSGVYEVISDQVIRPGPAERRSNPRCASAKFRWART